ncbi:Uncharacterised protein [Vibrio cholerae]|nr:Uncharacterised protein [Vibrio cholerae]
MIATGWSPTVLVAPFLLRDQIFDRTMQQQIRVTTDWRCKVCVTFQRQAKVTRVIRVIHRLLHRAQQHGLDQLFIWTFTNLLH